MHFFRVLFRIPAAAKVTAKESAARIAYMPARHEHSSKALPQLVLSMDGLVLREIVLDRERITIGRKSSNQVQIDDLAISGEHARITTILDDVFLEDLDSTNGTSVNGKPITRCVLSDGDVVDIGKYRMKFIAAREQESGLSVAVEGLAAGQDGEGKAAGAEGAGLLRVLDGPHAGREMPLSKARTMLGSPGGQVVAIVRRSEGYFLQAIEGKEPVVNGRQIEERSVPLGERALIELAGARMEFELCR